jgi:hypothetical protein
MRTLPCFLVRSALPIMLFLSGCASVSVQPGSQSRAAAAKPREIVVANFAFADGAKVRVDRSDQDLSRFKANLTSYFRASLGKNLQSFGIPVTYPGYFILRAKK